MIFVLLLLSVLWLLHNWVGGIRNAYLFSGGKRQVGRWDYTNVAFLLNLADAVPCVLFGAICAYVVKAFMVCWFVVGIGWLGMRVSAGSERVASGVEFFKGGQLKMIRLPFNCPEWVLRIGWPVISVRRSDRRGWLWEFRATGGKIQFVLASILYVSSLYFIVR
jgi:hypothetical protein